MNTQYFQTTDMLDALRKTRQFGTHINLYFVKQGKASNAFRQTNILGLEDRTMLRISE
jgi:hypothetical protein